MSCTRAGGAGHMRDNHTTMWLAKFDSRTSNQGDHKQDCSHTDQHVPPHVIEPAFLPLLSASQPTFPKPTTELTDIDFSLNALSFDFLDRFHGQFKKWFHTSGASTCQAFMFENCHTLHKSKMRWQGFRFELLSCAKETF
eukprot:3359863-Amphidinium_carterae.1